ncbi:tRNA (adenosine(37)-N6)-threonylcarbamoyltransferase complex ATPase subunit type 1 TsaE [Geomicrobium sp. JCM 19039]|uniref:tRNA (adenosine(37)-N6)-threonylcarbamoyltransferase complex ATPase subunit type 1 TsaE n=1 Tax=Geomicrobium sp. JCM 19039 TaxID=1460636 RepID=UPI00045F22DF|nr:tRNA (adenosine(37)-N6)-threonylcarbamoyltransferase complex ATPase subunit type 1 TsaE [Geomicrobium sp. JCM 19039]GAK13581.1 ATPase YjeE [Geomicrobium sp. JCM 19039]
MREYEILTNDTEETMRLGEQLGQVAKTGDVFTLDGDLGAGKTHFSKGFGKGLGVKGNINSPTFTIIKEYEGRLPFYHIDAYRLDESGEEDLGLTEFVDGDGVTVIEWPSRLSVPLPENTVHITLQRLGEKERRLKIKTNALHYTSVLEVYE